MFFGNALYQVSVECLARVEVIQQVLIIFFRFLVFPLAACDFREGGTVTENTLRADFLYNLLVGHLVT